MTGSFAKAVNKEQSSTAKRLIMPGSTDATVGEPLSSPWFAYPLENGQSRDDEGVDGCLPTSYLVEISSWGTRLESGS